MERKDEGATLLKPVVIIAAVTGGSQRSRDGAFVPITPEDIAEEAVLCRQAGASVVHIHGRDKDGINTTDPAVYAEIMRRIRERTDILVQTTNGVGPRLDQRTGEYVRPNDEQRLALLKLDPPPDFHGAAAGSVDYYHPEGGHIGESSFPNSGRFLQETIRIVYERGSSIEFEIAGATSLHRLRRYFSQEGIDPTSPYIGLAIPFLPGFCPDFRSFMFIHEEMQRLFPNAWRTTGGAGRSNFQAVTLALSLGFEGVRVGFEDSLYMPDGTIARRNCNLVEKLVEIAAIFGRIPATPAEARKILHLDCGPRTTAPV